MSVILARLIWSFDIKIAKESERWRRGLPGWTLWEKRPMWLHLEPRVA